MPYIHRKEQTHICSFLIYYSIVISSYRYNFVPTETYNYSYHPNLPSPRIYSHLPPYIWPEKHSWCILSLEYINASIGI